MSPEGVLSETQKKIRFRKLIQKRKKSGQRLPRFAGAEANKDESDTDDGDDDDDDDVEVVTEQTSCYPDHAKHPAKGNGFGTFDGNVRNPLYVESEYNYNQAPAIVRDR